MEKNIKMSLETARQMYKENNETTNKWLLENFTKEELEPKKGFTWEESFSGDGYYINRASRLEYIDDCHSDNYTNHNVFLTEKHAKSALAFAQLSHIMERYNQDKYFSTQSGRTTYYHVIKFNGKALIINNWSYPILNLPFCEYEDAETSMEVNRQLWLDYWMID